MEGHISQKISSIYVGKVIPRGNWTKQPTQCLEFYSKYFWAVDDHPEQPCLSGGNGVVSLFPSLVCVVPSSNPLSVTLWSSTFQFLWPLLTSFSFSFLSFFAFWSEQRRGEKNSEKEPLYEGLSSRFTVQLTGTVERIGKQGLETQKIRSPESLTTFFPFFLCRRLYVFWWLKQKTDRRTTPVSWLECRHWFLSALKWASHSSKGNVFSSQVSTVVSILIWLVASAKDGVGVGGAKNNNIIKIK